MTSNLKKTTGLVVFVRTFDAGSFSAANLANSLGGVIGGLVSDTHQLGAVAVPYAAIAASVLGLILIVTIEWRAHDYNDTRSLRATTRKAPSTRTVLFCV